ncbi:hypothetical protein J6590_035042 [Homalodisca vitripennis]|nr:hypothetical protein J6590_035042 [Homalodisca vitripennis]
MKVESFGLLIQKLNTSLRPGSLCLSTFACDSARKRNDAFCRVISEPCLPYPATGIDQSELRAPGPQDCPRIALDLAFGYYNTGPVIYTSKPLSAIWTGSESTKSFYVAGKRVLTES